LLLRTTRGTAGSYADGAHRAPLVAHCDSANG
jgi:hypothetical protein